MKSSICTVERFYLRNNIYWRWNETKHQWYLTCTNLEGKKHQVKSSIKAIRLGLSYTSSNPSWIPRYVSRYLLHMPHGPSLSVRSPDVKERISAKKEFCASLSTFHNSVHRPRHLERSTFVCVCARLLPFSPLCAFDHVQIFLCFFAVTPSINSIVPCIVGAVNMKKKRELIVNKNMLCFAAPRLSEWYLGLDSSTCRLPATFTVNVYCIYIYMPVFVEARSDFKEEERKKQKQQVNEKKLNFLAASIVKIFASVNSVFRIPSLLHLRRTW